MIHVLASIYIKPGKRSAFLEIFKSNTVNVLAEKGCISYVPAIDVPTGLPPQELNDSVVTIIEQWSSLETLKAHLTAPHMISYREKVRDLVDHSSLKVLAEA